MPASSFRLILTLITLAALACTSTPLAAQTQPHDPLLTKRFVVDGENVTEESVRLHWSGGETIIAQSDPFPRSLLVDTSNSTLGEIDGANLFLLTDWNARDVEPRPISRVWNRSAGTFSVDGKTWVIITGPGAGINPGVEAYFTDAFFYGNATWFSPTIGWFYNDPAWWPFVLHAEYGWWFCSGGSTNGTSMFIYDYTRGWIWTSQSVYPFYYGFELDPPRFTDFGNP